MPSHACAFVSHPYTHTRQFNLCNRSSQLRSGSIQIKLGARCSCASPAKPCWNAAGKRTRRTAASTARCGTGPGCSASTSCDRRRSSSTSPSRCHPPCYPSHCHAVHISAMLSISLLLGGLMFNRLWRLRLIPATMSQRSFPAMPVPTLPQGMHIDGRVLRGIADTFSKAAELDHHSSYCTARRRPECWAYSEWRCLVAKIASAASANTRCAAFRSSQPVLTGVASAPVPLADDYLNPVHCTRSAFLAGMLFWVPPPCRKVF